jgi:hypothetical protein
MLGSREATSYESRALVSSAWRFLYAKWIIKLLVSAALFFRRGNQWFELCQFAFGNDIGERLKKSVGKSMEGRQVFPTRDDRASIRINTFGGRSQA